MTHDCPRHGGPDQCRPCWFCGTYTDDWDYIGRERVAVCADLECLRRTVQANGEVAAQAALDAAEDGYERYL